jgi:TonB family protein
MRPPYLPCQGPLTQTAVCHEDQAVSDAVCTRRDRSVSVFVCVPTVIMRNRCLLIVWFVIILCSGHVCGAEQVPGKSERVDVDEVTIRCNDNKKLEFPFYLLGLKRKIKEVWVYPPDAEKNGILGTTTLKLSIARDGNLIGVDLLDSSGHPVLDQSAVNAVKSAAPYIPFPERMRAKRLRICAKFIYLATGASGASRNPAFESFPPNEEGDRKVRPPNPKREAAPLKGLRRGLQ